MNRRYNQPWGHNNEPNRSNNQVKPANDLEWWQGSVYICKNSPELWRAVLWEGLPAPPDRVELWVYNTNTTEDWTNKVDVLGKFTELWIAAMLWRHGVIKFDNCAGLNKAVISLALGGLLWPCSTTMYNLRSQSVRDTMFILQTNAKYNAYSSFLKRASPKNLRYNVYSSNKR